MARSRNRLLTLAATLLLQLAAAAQEPACSLCAEWNHPQKPFHLYGDTWFVGPHGLTVLLIVSPAGDILIDGGTRESAPIVAANIRALGFRMEDVKLILNSHVHHDHAGGIAALQRLTGAEVLASPASAVVMRAGGVARDDPQYGDIRGLEPIGRVRTLIPGGVVRLGPLALTPHPMPGHTAGGTSWTWTSCEGSRCERMVYADSVSAVAAPGYQFSEHPELIRQFESDFAWLDRVPCDILLTPHPDASEMFERRRTGKLVDPHACRKLADDGRVGLQEKLRGPGEDK